MKTVAMFLIVFFLFFGAAAVNAANFETYLKSSYMNWMENYPLSGKSPFVEESGLITSLGGNGLFYLTKNISSKLEMEIFGGEIDYRGSHLKDLTSYNTTGFWLGARLEETVDYKIKIYEDFLLSLFASVGFSMWWREVCAETWLNGYFRLGIQAEKGMFFARVGALIPFYTEEFAGLKDIPWLNEGKETHFELRPKGVPTPFAEIGIRVNEKITLSFSYEMRKWGESERVYFSGGAYVFQPEIRQDLFSLWLKVFF